jgi:hypothetical protein
MNAPTIPPKRYACAAEELIEAAALDELARVARDSHPMFARGWIAGVAFVARLEGINLSVLDLVRAGEGARCSSR